MALLPESAVSDLPFWYTQSINALESDTVIVDGIEIAFETWGEVGKPGIVLIHGSNAHLEWWRFTAPFLADRFRLAAIDLSGNGNSGWRERYTGKGFADEVWAVCEAARLGARPMVVRFGGFVALETGHYYGAILAAFCLWASRHAEESMEWGLRVEREGVEPGRKLRIYDDFETALSRFRFIPEQPGVNLVLKHLGTLAKQVPEGWTWKFDPGLFDYLEMGRDQHEKLMTLPCKTALMLGEQSEDEGALYGNHMLQASGGKLPVITVTGTYHHLMFDQPIAVASAMKFLLLEWHRQNSNP